VPQLVPPADLLSHVDGVEKSLRRARRIGIVGWAAFAVAAVQLVAGITLAGTGWVSTLRADWADWPFIATLCLLGISVLLVNWTRVWVRISREPFRYTYSVEDLEPVPGSATVPHVIWADDPPSGAVLPAEGTAVPPLAWLRHDLINELSERIGRLDLLEERFSGATKEPDAHIHIGGSYGLREKGVGNWVIEVLPWIRLGPTGSSARLSHNVEFPLGRLPELGVEDYEKLRERVYFSIATELYRQIRRDVQTKIDLLPKRYFRAAAYFHEAQDYSRSNTLDAYEQAQELFEAVLRLYDPRGWPSPGSSERRSVRRGTSVPPEWSLTWRRRLGKLWPRLAAVELMVVRAEIGYANVLLDRRRLAGMSGLRLNAVFEALPVTKRALEQLDSLPQDALGVRDARFDALVTLAATYSLLGSDAEASKLVEKAERLDPARADRNARFLYVRGLIEPRHDQAIQLLRLAVELAPHFEGAQFQLATKSEMFWRMRPTLEPNVAELVAAEYEAVLEINPGNVAAWANLGYVHWLLDDLPRAAQSFLRGRDYKNIKRETFVSELDYGLARIAAEQGDFKTAYDHYISAASALFAPSASANMGDQYTAYHFELINRAVVQRFALYVRRVREQVEAFHGSVDATTSTRSADSVYAFVLNDFAEACFNYFLRTNDRRFLDRAEEALLEAETKLKTRYALAYFNLFRVLRLQGAATERIEAVAQRIVQYAPYWPDAKLEIALWQGEAATLEALKADQLDSEAKAIKEHADELARDARRRQQELRAAQFAGSRPPSADESSWANLLEHQPSVRPEGDAATAPTRFTHEAERELVTIGDNEPGSRAALTPRADPGVRAASPADHEALRADVRRLFDMANEFLREAKRRRGLAFEARARAKGLKREASEKPAEFLPHRWLWMGDPARRQLDRTVFDRPDYRLERKLERELDILHVRALVAWEAHDVPKGDADRAMRTAVLKHLLLRFLPDNFQVLLACRDACGDDTGAQRGYDERLCAVIKGLVTRDPGWWSLRLTVAEDIGAFDAGAAVETLCGAGEARGLPDGAAIWIGDALLQLAERGGDPHRCREFAEIAFARAGEATDPMTLLDLAEVLERHKYTERSLEMYRRSRDLAETMPLDPELPQPLEPDEYRRRIAFVLSRLGRMSEASDEISAIDEGELSRTAWRADLVRALLGENVIRSVETYRPLKTWLGQVVTRAKLAGNDVALSDAADALLELTLRRYQEVVRRPHDRNFAVEAAAMTPTVAPITVAADHALFPEGENTKELKRLLQADGPLGAMKHRIRQSMGVFIPGISFTPLFGAPPGRFLIHVHDAPVAAGSVADDGETLTERYRAIVEYLEHILRANLAAFVRIQDVDWMLAEWEAESTSEYASRAALRVRAVPDKGALARLAAVLQGLVQEGVPIVDLGAILTAFAGTPAAADSVERIEHVRAALANVLPGTDAARPLLRVPTAVEQLVAGSIHARRGKRFLVASGKDADAARLLLGNLLDDAGDGGAALVVSSSLLRPGVRRLVAVDRPSVPVVSIDELPDAVLSSADWSRDL
jgi:tetratricopeptide (TPR) repeat protein